MIIETIENQDVFSTKLKHIAFAINSNGLNEDGWAKGGCISSIVPMVSHLDHSEHSVNVIITEQGIADLRGKSPMERAQAVIENCAHPDYKQLLWDYLKISTKGQTCHSLSAALGMHQVFIKQGDMRLTNWADFEK